LKQEIFRKSHNFYCTELEEQAVRWASRYDIAVVSIYEYMPDENLKILAFKEMTEEWLDFIDCILTYPRTVLGFSKI